MHIETRTKPINLNDNDDYLFQHEYEYICAEPIIKQYTNRYFNTEGYIYENFTSVIEKYSPNKVTKSNKIKNFIKCLLFGNKIIQDDIIFIHDYWSNGYFHWNADALPKLFFLSRQLLLNNYKLVILKEYLQFDYIRESLDLFGIKVSDCIIVDNSKIFKCKKITYCPPFTNTGNYHSDIINEMSLFLKNKAGVKLLEPRRYIYISRKNAAKRRVINEDEVEALLSKFNFEIIETENMTYIQQIHLFNETKWLISIHGAALTNMLFMNNNANVLEFRNEKDKSNNCYFSLASAMKLNYFYLKNERVDNESTDHVGDLQVDINKLEKLLQLYLYSI